MDMQVQLRDGITVVTLTGELSDPDQEFIDELTTATARPAARVLIDLSGVPYLNSSGIGLLVRAVAQAHTVESRVALAGLTPFVKGVMEVTKLTNYFKIFPSVADAAAALRQP